MAILKWLGKFMSFVLILVVLILLTLYLMCLIFCYGPSKNARNLFVTTFLETGQMKFVVHLVMSDEEINKIIALNSMDSLTEEVDETLITPTLGDDKNDIELVNVSGSNYSGKMLIIKDPSRVKVTSIYDGAWKNKGVTLDKLVNDADALAGVNGGLYVSSGNSGGRPLGLVVQDHQITYNNPVGIDGLYLIGFNDDNILRIINIANKSASEVENIVKNEKIRDAIAFQDAKTPNLTLFVKLIINGEKRKLNGSGSGANPRTAIGQRSDGTVLLLVTDGRGANGHLGATAADLIEIMNEYGAINAANIDGGSSSCMYYMDHYEMTSVTLVHSNNSWRLPTSFIVEKR